MKCLIIGSVALKHHLGDILREPADLDLMVDSDETKAYILDNQEKMATCLSHYGIEYKKYKLNFMPTEDISNEMIFRTLNHKEDFFNIDIASLNCLKLLKLSSEPWGLKKHTLDLEFLKDIDLNWDLKKILRVRLNETKNRACTQKNKFFSKAISRYISHDRLHLYAAPAPAYKLILEDNHSYKGSKLKFEKLDLESQFRVVAEELFVFALERWLIPEYVNNKVSIGGICDKFLTDKTTSGPMHHWIFKFMEIGGVQRNPIWISEWISVNYFYLLNNIELWWENTFHQLPEQFWMEVLDIKNEKNIY